jgi:hypothetical protein
VQQEIILHHDYEDNPEQGRDVPEHLKQLLSARRRALLERVRNAHVPALDVENQEWKARSYPILSILAPVMTTSAGKIEFPGDPMCLYAALSYAVDQVVQAAARDLRGRAVQRSLSAVGRTSIRRISRPG